MAILVFSPDAHTRIFCSPWLTSMSPKYPQLGFQMASGSLALMITAILATFAHTRGHVSRLGVHAVQLIFHSLA